MSKVLDRRVSHKYQKSIGVPSITDGLGQLKRGSWRPRAVILIMSVALLAAGGNYLRGYSETTSVSVPQRSNSALIMHPNSTNQTMLGLTNTSRQYSFLLDANATLYFGVFESPSLSSVGFCSLSGHLVYEKESAEINETLSLGPGNYAYMICNRGTETAFGEFQYSILRTSVTQPHYSFGSFLGITAGLVTVWGLSLLPETLYPRSKTVRYSRFLRWTLLAPAVLLFGSICFGGAISADVNTDPLPLILASIIMIAAYPEMLFVTLAPPMLLLCFLTLLLTVSASFLARTFRVWAKARPIAVPHQHHFSRLLLSQLDLFSRLSANLVLPDEPHVGVFVRLGIVSLFTAQVLTMSPWEFVRGLHPYLDLPPWILPMESSAASLGLGSLLLPIAMSIFGLFAYSLRWKPSAPNAFRTIRTVYLALFLVSLFVVLWHLLSTDYLIELVGRFILILPLTLVSAYLAWISEFLIRRIIISSRNSAVTEWLVNQIGKRIR